MAICSTSHARLTQDDKDKDEVEDDEPTCVCEVCNDDVDYGSIECTHCESWLHFDCTGLG